jgi:hypothetical protein
MIIVSSIMLALSISHVSLCLSKLFDCFIPGGNALYSLCALDITSPDGKVIAKNVIFMVQEALGASVAVSVFSTTSSTLSNI